MLGRDEEVICADAYIDALLASHGGEPTALPGAGALLPAGIRRAIAALEALPRFHPSFVFEEGLASRLRGAAAPATSYASVPPGADIVPLPLPAPYAAAASIARDRRLLVGGAIASTVSLAGAAVLVRAAQQRRGRGRPRTDWLS